MRYEGYEDLLNVFDPNLASGSDLDRLCSYIPLSRQIYGFLYHEKPNDHCVWTDVGYMYEMWRWVENDEHFRNRLKGKSK